jgi:GNAT superfamily N-acetyltransferase
MSKNEIKQELFLDILDELKPVLPVHWLELALDRDEIPLDPDYDFYLACEGNGRLHVCTARADGELVGYFITFVVPSPHYRTTLFGKVDIYYVRREHRRNGTGAALFDFHEAEMRRLGVKKVVNMCKIHQDHAPLFLSRGYSEIERTFSKLL